jgi:hypothetical protein
MQGGGPTRWVGAVAPALVHGVRRWGAPREHLAVVTGPTWPDRSPARLHVRGWTHPVADGVTTLRFGVKASGRPADHRSRLVGWRRSARCGC